MQCNNNFTAADSEHCIASTGEAGNQFSAAPSAGPRPGAGQGSGAPQLQLEADSSRVPALEREPIHHTAGTHGPPCWWCGGPGRQQQWGHSPVTQHSTVRPGHCWPPAPGTTAAHGEMFNTPAILIAAAILISLL